MSFVRLPSGMVINLARVTFIAHRAEDDERYEHVELWFGDATGPSSGLVGEDCAAVLEWMALLPPIVSE